MRRHPTFMWSRLAPVIAGCRGDIERFSRIDSARTGFVSWRSKAQGANSAELVRGSAGFEVEVPWAFARPILDDLALSVPGRPT